MTLNELLQEVINDIDVKKRPTFINANKFDANLEADNSNFPLCVLVEPGTTIETMDAQGQVQLEHVINLMWAMLSKPDWKQVDDNEKCILPMRVLSTEFLMRLSQHSLIKSITFSTRTNFTKIMDVNMSGVYHNIRFKVISEEAVCL